MKAVNNEKDVPRSLPCLPVTKLQGHEGPIHAVRFTADGKYCLTAGQDRTVRLWNPTRLDPIYPTQLSHYLSSIATSSSSIPTSAIPPALPIQQYTFSHPVSKIHIDDSSKYLLCSLDKTLVVSDVMTQSVIRKLYGHNGRINSISCSEETYITGSYDGTVRIWDARSRSHDPIQILKDAKDSISSVLYLPSPSNEILTASVDGMLRTYDLRMGRLYSDDFVEPIFSVSKTCDEKCVVVSSMDGFIYIVEKKSNQILNYYRGSHSTKQNFALECAVLSNDEYIVTGSDDGNVVIYPVVGMRGGDDFFTEPAKILKGHTRPTCSVAVCPKRETCSLVISASYDGNAIVWGNPHQL